MPSAGDHFDRLSRKTEFEVTDEHLKLLRHADVTWDYAEYGAAGINCDRPYGNSDVTGDIGKILGYTEDYWRDEHASERDHETVADNFAELHAGAGIALQIALATGEFRPGRYARSSYYLTDWHPAES